MIYNLNQEIKTIEGDAIRPMDNQLANLIVQQCTNTLKNLAGDEESEIVSEFKKKAPQNVLGEALTYRQVIRQALLNIPKEENPKESDQLERYDLLIKLAADKVELESSEIKKIRSAVASNYKHPIIIGRLRDLLEMKEEPSVNKKKAAKKPSPEESGKSNASDKSAAHKEEE